MKEFDQNLWETKHYQLIENIAAFHQPETDQIVDILTRQDNTTCIISGLSGIGKSRLVRPQIVRQLTQAKQTPQEFDCQTAPGYACQRLLETAIPPYDIVLIDESRLLLADKYAPQLPQTIEHIQQQNILPVPFLTFFNSDSHRKRQLIIQKWQTTLESSGYSVQHVGLKPLRLTQHQAKAYLIHQSQLYQHHTPEEVIDYIINSTPLTFGMIEGLASSFLSSIPDAKQAIIDLAVLRQHSFLSSELTLIDNLITSS